MWQIRDVLEGVKWVVPMIIVQFILAGMNILYKLAENGGMNVTIFVAYRWIFATSFICPLALILERKRPKITWIVSFQAFLCGLLGGTAAQILFLEGMKLTSATFSTAIEAVIPALTLLFATILGMEKLKLRTAIGKAKILGTLIGLGGVMLITFYRGEEIRIWSTNIHLFKYNHNDEVHQNHNQILGSSMQVANCACMAFWLIIQTKMSKRYPYPYSSTALMSLMASIQCVILSLCMDRNWSQWKLGWNIKLLAAIYSGILTSGLSVTLIIWCINARGPVFVASFNPLSVVFVAIVGYILGEKLNLGCILGAATIVCGLYVMLWGQNKEIKEKTELIRINLPITNQPMETNEDHHHI